MKNSEPSPPPASEKSYLDKERFQDHSKIREARTKRQADLAAFAELARRELVKRDLLEYNKQFWPEKQWQFNWFHQEVAGIIQDSFAKAMKDNCRINLSFSVPPGHSKTQLVTRSLPGWILGNHPDKEILIATASQDLSNNFGREIRDRMNDPEYAACFPSSIPRDDSNAVDYMVNRSGGKLTLGGWGAMWNGLRGHLMVGDDLIKDREFAESEGQMDKLWGWLNSTFMQRRYPACLTIIMHTRWAVKDVIGRIQDTDKQGLWQHIVYPAIAEEDEKHRKKGEALQPEWISLKSLEEERGRLTELGLERDWLALFQQHPTNASGNFFKSEWLDFVPLKDYPKDEDLEWYIGTDFAASTKKTADRTALVPIGVDKRGDLWMAQDAHFDRTTTLDSVEKLLDLCKKYSPLFLASEKGPLNSSIGPILTKRMQERNIFCRIEEVARSQGKYVYAAPLQARFQQKKVHFPDTQFYRLNVAPQFLNFAPGVDGVDDFIDAASTLLMVLEKMGNWKSGPPIPKVATAIEDDKEMWDKILQRNRVSKPAKMLRLNGKPYR